MVHVNLASKIVKIEFIQIVFIWVGVLTSFNLPFQFLMIFSHLQTMLKIKLHGKRNFIYIPPTKIFGCDRSAIYKYYGSFTYGRLKYFTSYTTLNNSVISVIFLLWNWIMNLLRTQPKILSKFCFDSVFTQFRTPPALELVHWVARHRLLVTQKDSFLEIYSSLNKRVF